VLPNTTAVNPDTRPVMNAMLRFEEAFWSEHPAGCLVGIDEAGRGPLAGPVVAGAVSIAPDAARSLVTGALAGLTDSKQLSAARRAAFFQQLAALPEICLGWGLAEPEEIDRINILRATHAAMARAVAALPGPPPTHALVDGLPVKGLPCPSTAIVKGDAASLLIAAASIVAKVTRDALMDALDSRHPEYGFARHKGYPTAEHLAALQTHGPCPAHRQTYGPVAEQRQRTFL